MFGYVAEGIIQLIIYIVFEIFLIGTGEIILFILTLGKRKPVWKRENKGGVIKFYIFIDISFIIGFIFWLSIAWLLFK